MKEEYWLLMANDTWDLFLLPKGRKLIICMWVYKTKYASNGSVDKHKANTWKIVNQPQSKYVCDLLNCFHMEDCKPTPSPFQSGVKPFYHLYHS